MSLKLLITLVGLILIVEGIPYVAFPEAMQRWMQQLAAMRPEVLRGAGLAALATGLALCYLAQRTGLIP